MCLDDGNKSDESCFEVLSNTAKKLSLCELEKMAALYRRKAEENIFIAPQLMSYKDVILSNCEDDSHYNI